jgi:hypothetical protein
MNHVQSLWARFHVLRAAILSYLNRGVSETDQRVIQARHQQRMVAEQLVEAGAASGIAFARDGDLSPFQKKKAKDFQVQDEPTRGPRDQVVGLKTVRFSGEAGSVNEPVTEKTSLGSIEGLLWEARVSSSLGRGLSHLEGSIRVDYVIDNDTESGIDL